MAFYFSPSKLAFFDGALKADYKAAGTWPSDAAEISAKVEATYTAQPPAGKVLGAKNGKPAWVDAPAPPAPTLAQQATAAISGTIALTSKSASALNGAYSIDPATVQDMESEILAFDTNGAFLDGDTSIEWPDTSGSLHTFTSAQFKAFVTAIGAYVGQLKAIRRTGKLPSGMTALPGNSISIS